MDYVKCEAMQSASARIRSSMDKKANDFAIQNGHKVFLEFCGVTREQARDIVWNIKKSDRTEEQQKIIDCDGETIKERRAIFLKVEAEELARQKARLAKIEADYNAEGCY